MGMLLQLTALTYLNRWMKGHYLVATIVAVELAVMHNFIWHLRYTWSDRGGGGGPLVQFARFHLANGFVSLLGNLALMPLLFRAIGLPLLISNSIAILCCSIVNFSVSNRWVFAQPG
jgi:putative flippase GtrA